MPCNHCGGAYPHETVSVHSRVCACDIPTTIHIDSLPGGMAYEMGCKEGAAKERERVFAALFRDAEQMYGWTREETLDQFPRLAAIERGEHTEAPDAE